MNRCTQVQMRNLLWVVASSAMALFGDVFKCTFHAQYKLVCAKAETGGRRSKQKVTYRVGKTKDDVALSIVNASPNNCHRVFMK